MHKDGEALEPTTTQFSMVNIYAKSTTCSEIGEVGEKPQIGPSKPGTTMVARAVLLCRQNSHPFDDRSLVFDRAIRVGRSVARARPAVDNAVFDCRVLSRSHAKLWYDNGKDTKSSNGTFVNNQRLSKNCEESLPRELSSGDILQFGVDVAESSRKVTHGCIIATIKLYLSDGTEAIACPSVATVDTTELFQLSKYLQEALYREQMLENKLKMLQKLVASSEKAAETSWKALIDEDRLLSRLEMLEYQVQTCPNNISEDSLQKEVLRLQSEKDCYQVTAKKLLKNVLQEKLEAVKKLHNAEMSLSNAESQCKNLLEQYETATKELQDLRSSYVARLREIQDLTDKLQDAENKGNMTSEKIEKSLDKKSLEIEEDHADNELSKDQLFFAKDDVDSILISPDKNDLESDESCKLSQGIQVNLIENERPVHNEELIENLRQSENELIEIKGKVSDVNKLLEKAQVDALKSMNRVAQLEVQLQEARSQLETSNTRIKQLEDQIDSMEKELHKCLTEGKSEQKLTIVYKSEIEPPTPTITLPLPPRSVSPVLKTNGEIAQEKPDDTSHSNVLKSEIEKLKELLAETRENKSHAEKEVARFKAELEDARNNVKRAADDSNVLRKQLELAVSQDKEKSEIVSKLQDQVKHAELSSREVQQQIYILKEKLSQEQVVVQTKQDEIDKLRQQLMEAQHNYKQAHNEAEQLRNKLESFVEMVKKQSVENFASPELLLMREECDSLKKIVHNLEATLQETKNENKTLKDDLVKISQNESEHDLSPSSVISNVTEESLHQHMAEANQKLLMAFSEIITLKETCSAYNEEATRLKRELDLGRQDIQVRAFNLLPLIIATIGILLIFYPKLAIITATFDPSLPS